MENNAQQKRNLERKQKEEELKSYGVFIKIYRINSINFAGVNDFKKLFLFHFLKNEIPLLINKIVVIIQIIIKILDQEKTLGE
jgi:hypothetical protein